MVKAQVRQEADSIRYSCARLREEEEKVGKGEGGYPFYAWPAGLSASSSHDSAIPLQASKRQNYEEHTLTTHCSVRLPNTGRDGDGAEVVVTM
jgi:hypothetical protein